MHSDRTLGDIPDGQESSKNGSSLDERLDDLSRHIETWLDEARLRADNIKEIITGMRGEFQPPASEVEPSPVALGVMAGFARDIEGGTDQAQLLGKLMEASASLAPRVALFVVRQESFEGWASKGFPAAINPRSISHSIEADTVLRAAIREGKPIQETLEARVGNAQLAGSFGAVRPLEMLASPLWVKDRVAGILYADSGEGTDPWFPEAISVMATLTGLSLEAIPMRARFPRFSRFAAAAPDPSPSRTTREDPSGTIAVATVTPAADEEIPPNGPTPAEDSKPAAGRTGADEPEDERRAHEIARRFARLLVSEILLYNERKVEEGRLRKDLYERLKDDIERSHRMYQERISPRVSDGPNYFREELVRSLANGDESALKLPWG